MKADVYDYKSVIFDMLWKHKVIVQYKLPGGKENDVNINSGGSAADCLAELIAIELIKLNRKLEKGIEIPKEEKADEAIQYVGQ